MNPLCYELLNGTLIWNGSAAPYTTTITNNLPVAVSLDFVPNPGAPMPTLSGSYQPVITLSPNGGVFQTHTDPNTSPGVPAFPAGYYRASVAATGSLVDVFDCSSATPSVRLDGTVLSAPNDIGPIPVPTARIVDPAAKAPGGTSTMVIPPDSPRVLVACGTTPAPNYNLITREQYWARQNDSICLAGHEKRTVTYSVTSGMQQTSSDLTTLSASLSSSISGGWGPTSASLSASLSASSTSFQQVTVTQESTSYVSNKIHNPNEEPIAYLRWQLTDVITVFDKTTGQPISCLVRGENPTIVMGPYWVSPRQTPLAAGPAPAGLFEYE